MRFLIGALVAIGAFILIIVLIIKLVFGGGGTPKNALDLNSYSNTDYEMRLTIDGPVNADSEHGRVQITVGQSDTVIDVMRGYQGNVTKTKTIDNNSDSYNAFLHALTIAGYNLGDDNPKNADETGQCAMGDRYVFSVINPDGKEVQHYWSTSCGGGTYRGDSSRTLDLFKAQVPVYDDITNDVDL